MSLESIKEKVLAKKDITKEDAMELVEADLNELSAAADEIRKQFCGDKFEMCAVMNVRGGRCSENCRFCSQSTCSTAKVPTFSIRNEKHVKADALKRSGIGISHYCQVASGRKMSKDGIEQICKNTKKIVESTDLTPCVSLGLLDKEDLLKLKASGVKRVHNNLETSRDYFPLVCQSHTYDEKMHVLRRVR